MESRGQGSSNNPKPQQPAIARRACDPCRVRKIACDRGSPCANCVTARVECTHSAIASAARASTAKQRVLISSQYEQKIDDIVRGISGINLLLQRMGSPATTKLHDPGQDGFVEVKIDPESLHSYSEKPLWDYSAHLAEFVKDFATESRKYASSDMSGVITSLADVAGVIDGPPSSSQGRQSRNSSSPHNAAEGTRLQKIPMPPLEDAVTIMRWAREHETYKNVSWLSRLLPHSRFTEICQKVYFAVEDYSDIEFLLANGYLHYMFIEHFFASATAAYRDYCCLCRFNLESTFRRLPLFLPANVETIAALTLAASNSIENGNALTAWTFVSNAWDLCQRAGYHLRTRTSDSQSPAQANQESLFRAIYELDRGLALRLGRSPQIRETDITLPIGGPFERRSTRVARIQGMIYDELCSPRSIVRPVEERSYHAERLASELRDVILETNSELADALSRPGDDMLEPSGLLHLQTELVCQSSLLTLTLRAAPTARGQHGGISEECLAAARDTLKMHDACIGSMQSFEGIEYMMERYRNWSILHTPFVAFSILFTYAIEQLDLTELAKLDDFAASLGQGPLLEQTPPLTHPHRLYELLCKAARLYIYANSSSSEQYEEINIDQRALADALNELDYSHINDLGMLGGYTSSEGTGTLDLQAPETWVFNSQG